MIKLRSAVVGLGAILERLKKADATLMAQMRLAVARVAVDLVADVKLKLSDDVLRVRSGTLRRSVGYKLVEDPTGVIAVVGTNLRYGAVHEFGYDGPQQVAAHMRKVTQAFGRPLTRPTVARIRAHVRHVHFPERSFVRSALAENLEEIRLDIQRAADAAAKETLHG